MTSAPITNIIYSVTNATETIGILIICIALIVIAGAFPLYIVSLIKTKIDDKLAEDEEDTNWWWDKEENKKYF